MPGTAPCRDCGVVTNIADLVGRLCPACQRSRIEKLSGLQRRYEIAAYQKAEGIRLRSVAHAYRVD